MGAGIGQAGSRGALEVDAHVAAAGQFDVVGGVLRHVGLALHGVAAMGRVNRHRLDVVALVAIASIGKVRIVQEVGDHPVGEHVVEGDAGVVLGQRLVEPVDAVGVGGHRVLRQLVAEALQEVRHEQVGVAIVLGAAVGVVTPGVQLRVGQGAEGVVSAAAVVAVQLRSQLAHSLVDPTGLVLVLVPVDHVLELMRQHAVVEVGVGLGVVDVDVEHLPLVGEGLRLVADLIGATEIAGNAVAKLLGVQDVQPRVVVHAGTPFAAEEVAVGRVGRFGELVGRGLQSNRVVFHAVFDPHIHHVIDISQRRIDLEMLVGVVVVDPELLAFVQPVGGRRVVDDLRDWPGAAQFLCQHPQVSGGDDSFLQLHLGQEILGGRGGCG